MIKSKASGTKTIIFDYLQFFGCILFLDSERHCAVSFPGRHIDGRTYRGVYKNSCVPLLTWLLIHSDRQSGV